MLAKLGDLEVKPDQPVIQPGDRVQISINIGQGSVTTEKEQGVTIDVTPETLSFPVQHG